jgi:MFS family permease
MNGVNPNSAAQQQHGDNSDGENGETGGNWSNWRKTPRENRGILFSFTRFIWVVGVMVAFIVASPVLAPYYALEKIYGRIKWAQETYNQLKEWAETRGTLYLIVRVAGLILILLLFILIAPLLAPYYAIKRICNRMKWASKSYPYIYPYLEDCFTLGATRSGSSTANPGGLAGTQAGAATRHYKTS